MKHAPEFSQLGLSEAEIPKLIMRTLREGEIIGYQGKGTGRPIYAIDCNGHTVKVAITVSRNGYIVGANPKGVVK